MLYEFTQINATGNGSSTISYIVRNPRMENGMTVAEIVGVFSDFSPNTGEYIFKACEPKQLIVGGNFTMVEFTRELVTEDSMDR